MGSPVSSTSSTRYTAPATPPRSTTSASSSAASSPHSSDSRIAEASVKIGGDFKPDKKMYKYTFDKNSKLIVCGDKTHQFRLANEVKEAPIAILYNHVVADAIDSMVQSGNLDSKQASKVKKSSKKMKEIEVKIDRIHPNVIFSYSRKMRKDKKSSSETVYVVPESLKPGFTGENASKKSWKHIVSLKPGLAASAAEMPDPDILYLEGATLEFTSKPGEAFKKMQSLV